MQRFSKKRESILEILRSTKEHPSAEWVYEKLKPIYPDLSLATVYRNLSQLKDEGYIRSVGFVQGEERFDGFTEAHAHFVCVRCGKVVDITGLDIPVGFSEKAAAAAGGKVSFCDLRFSGICAECEEK